MKVILSRKGFDSNTGGIPSPIFENGDMVSFPIPENVSEGVKEDQFCLLQYEGVNFSTILDNLGYSLSKNQKCHMDPDLEKERRIKPIEDWEAIFGQCEQPASYLLKTIKVGIGDIFLFFSNYHFVKKSEEKYRKINHSGNFYRDNDIQVIWGYLQVGSILDGIEEQKKRYWHPHASEYYLKKKNNIMFVASEKFSLNSNLPGYGVFKFRKDRVLTKENHSKANWVKNPVYDCENKSFYGNRKNSSIDPKNSIYYQGQWQELGLVESPECTEWAKKLIEE